MIALIVAYDRNRVIGNKGHIPWDIKEDKLYFKALTTSHVVIMGRRTYEEIGKPLANRTNVVISKTKNFDQDGCYTVGSLKEALELFKDQDIYIAGGALLYKEALDIVDEMYITEIDGSYEGDTYFPEFDKSLFIEEVIKEVKGDINYRYLRYIRKK